MGEGWCWGTLDVIEPRLQLLEEALKLLEALEHLHEARPRGKLLQVQLRVGAVEVIPHLTRRGHRVLLGQGGHCTFPPSATPSG